jgi:mono/diheme cytochrome c family protein
MCFTKLITNMLKFIITMFFVLFIQNIKAQSTDKGKKLYTTYCLACHMADGGGVPNLNPPLANSTTVLKNTNKTIQIILKGLNSRDAIDGEYYSNSMAGFNYLKDNEIADIVNFIRNNFGNKGTAISIAQVKKERSKK